MKEESSDTHYNYHFCFFFFPSLHWAYHISFSQRCAMCSSAPSLSLLATVATATTQPTSAFLLFPSLSLSLSLVLVLCGQQKHTHTPPDHRSTQACRPPVALIRILWLPTANNLKATPPKHSSNLRQSRACKKKRAQTNTFLLLLLLLLLSLSSLSFLPSASGQSSSEYYYALLFLSDGGLAN